MISMSELLELECLDTDLYRSCHNQKNGQNTLFGGQILSQALLAAEASVADITPHSMHAYFLRAGDGDKPVIYEVERIRDGRSFVTRRVVASQDGKAIFSMSASFHNGEQGFSHQPQRDDMPSVPADPTDEEKAAQYSETGVSLDKLRQLPSFRQFDYLPVGGPTMISAEPGEPRGSIWIRCRGDIPAEPAARRAALLAATDIGLVNACLFPHPSHPFMPNQVASSLDHSIWFHHDADPSEWMLYETESPWTGKGRGLGRGLLFDPAGKLLATTVQETLIRVLDR